MSSNDNIKIHLDNLAEHAMALGLMPRGSELVYEKGSRVNGIAPGVWALPTDDPEGRKGRSRPDFLPRFNQKHTAKDVELALESAERALFAVNLMPKE